MGYNARTWAEAGPQRRRAAPDRHSEGTQLRPPGRLTPHAHTSAEAGPHSAAKEHSLGVPGSGHRNAGKGKRGFRRQSRPSLQGCSNHVPQSCFPRRRRLHLPPQQLASPQVVVERIFLPRPCSRFPQPLISLLSALCRCIQDSGITRVVLFCSRLQFGTGGR